MFLQRKEVKYFIRVNIILITILQMYDMYFTCTLGVIGELVM